MSISVVLVMHGVPPTDFPKEEMMELFGLQHRQAHASESELKALQKRHEKLEEKMRNWIRTPEKDPYHAASQSPDKIIVTTPMMTRGGEHSEKDIPFAVKRAQELYPGVEIVYAWPYDISDVAGFLAKHVKRFI